MSSGNAKPDVLKPNDENKDIEKQGQEEDKRRG
jgi:hypothetical protein